MTFTTTGSEILDIVEYEKTHQKMNTNLISQELLSSSNKYKATWYVSC